MLKLGSECRCTRQNLHAVWFARFSLMKVHSQGQNTRDGLVMNVLMFPLATVPGGKVKGNAQIAPSDGR